MKKIVIIITACTILIAITLYLIYSKNDNIVKKPDNNSKYNYILLDNSYELDITTLANEVSRKKFDRLQNYITEMLQELEQVEPSPNTDYYKYYNQYEQILSYEKHFGSHKQLAKRVLQEIEFKISNLTLTERDIQPLLTYLVFKKYSCFFKKQWFCLPYLKFSNDMYKSYIGNIDSFLDSESNYNNRTQLYPESFSSEEEIYFHITQELSSKLLNQLKKSNSETNSEFYSFYNLLRESSKDEYSLVYTILE